MASKTTTTANAYPDVVLLVNQYGQGICTGTLINARTVLTAAHCVYDVDDQRLSLGRGAGIGFSPLGPVAGPNNRAVSGVLANGGYGRDNTHDIALISLAEPVGSVTPVMLAQPGMPIPAPGSLGRVVGYGAYGTGSAPPIVNVGPSDDKRRVARTHSA